MSCTRPSTDLPLADLLENLALPFSPVSTATSKCVVFFPTAPQAAFATKQLKLQTPLEVRPHIGIMVILLTISNNPAIDA